MKSASEHYILLFIAYDGIWHTLALIIEMKNGEIMKYKTLEQRYSREETLKCSLVFETHDFGYTPVVFINPNGFHECHSGDSILCHYDLKAVYMLELWKEVKKRTDSKYFWWDKVEWYFNPDDYFQKMVFYDTARKKKAISYFWEELQKLADSGEIVVEEIFYKEGNKKIWVFNSLGSKMERGYCPHFAEIIDSPQKRTWKWNEIKEFFVELSDKELEFLHGKNLNQCTIKDLSLFEACDKGDFDRIKQAIKNGANVNATDKDGQGCLQKLLDQYRVSDEFSNTEDKNVILDKYKELIDYLLNQGLNINLYGFDDGEDPILCAHWIGSTELMEFLIQKGASIHQNPFITDLGDSEQSLIASATYDYVETDLAIGDYDTDTLIKEEAVLEKAGIKFWIDGWDSDKVTEFYDELWERIVYE